MIDSLLLKKGSQPELFISICLSTSTQTRRTLHVFLDYLGSRYLDRLPSDASSSNPTIGAAAGVIRSLAREDESRIQEIVKWCTSSSGAGLGHGTALRRAVLAALSQDKETITAVLEKSLAQFGDELYIRHAALMQQNGRSGFQPSEVQSC